MPPRKRKPKNEIVEEVNNSLSNIAIPQEITEIEELVMNPIKRKVITEWASVGGTLGTIAAQLGLSLFKVKSWIERGKEEFHKNEKDTSPYAELWRIVSSGLATARGLAEAKVAAIDPKFFLTKGPARLLGNDWEEADEELQESKLQVGIEFVQALKLLRKQGFDLNEIIDKDKLDIMIKPEAQEDANNVLEQEGIITLNQGLPGSLQNMVEDIENKLNLNYGTPNNGEE